MMFVIACIPLFTLPCVFLSVKNEPDCSPLDDSLTNIQWLGRMNAHVATADPAKKDSNKENVDGCVQFQEVLFFWSLLVAVSYFTALVPAKMSLV